MRRTVRFLYEYPFSERVRTLLRLEDLFDKLMYFCAQEHAYCHHTALLTLFEISKVTSSRGSQIGSVAGARASQAVASGAAQQSQVSEVRSQACCPRSSAHNRI